MVTAPVDGQSNRAWRSSFVVAHGQAELTSGGSMGWRGMIVRRTYFYDRFSVPVIGFFVCSIVRSRDLVDCGQARGNNAPRHQSSKSLGAQPHSFLSQPDLPKYVESTARSFRGDVQVFKCSRTMSVKCCVVKVDRPTAPSLPAWAKPR